MGSSATRGLLKAALFTLIIAFLSTGFLFLFPGKPDLKALLFLLVSFYVFISLSLVILNIGLGKPGDVQHFFSLAAIGLKFFLSAILALVYIMVLKKTGLEYILLYFILYLAFTIYLVRVMLKTLKIKSLKQDKV